MRQALEAAQVQLQAALAALGAGRRDDAGRELRAALPALADAVAADETFLGATTIQCALMALLAGDAETARAFAALVLTDASRRLEELGRWHRSEVERIERAGAGAPDEDALERARAVLADMYTYAVGFVPAVTGQTLVSLLSAAHPDDPDAAAALDSIVTTIRPQLDAAGWERWAYAPETLRRAHVWSAYAFVHLGDLWLDNAGEGRDIEDAERLAAGALRLIAADAGDRLQADALSLHGRALARYGAMHLDEAIAELERALEILVALGDDAGANAERANLGALTFERHQFVAANDPPAAQALLETAQRYLEDAVAGLRANDPYGRLPGALTNLGVVYTEREDRANAEATLREADARIPQTRSTFETRAKIAVNLGALLSDMKRYADAVPWFRKALDAKPRDGKLSVDPELEAMAAGGLGVALLFSAGASDAAPYLRRAFDEVESYRSTFYSERVNASLLQRFRWIYEADIACSAALGETDPAYRSRAFETAEKLKWRTLTTLLRYVPLGLIDETAEPVIAEERALLAFLAQRVLGDPDAVKRDADVVGALERLDAIWDGLAPRYPDYVAIRRQETVNVPAARALLDEHVPVLVEYYLGDQYDTSLAFVLTRDAPEPHIVRLPANRERIAQLVAAVRGQTAGVPAAAFRTAAAALYDAVMAPLTGVVPEGAGVCIVPYGPLHNAPFSGLWDGRRYAIERNPLTVAAGATALRWQVAKDRQRRDDCLIFTAPAGVTADGRRLDDLSLFADLARRLIAPSFAHTTLLAGDDASKERLLAAFAPAGAPAPDVAHIACHGIAKANGYESCLVMAAGAEGAARELTALEISAGRPLQTTLVTLSACDSAVLQTSTGDNIFGLAPAFLMAGASSVLATLWEIRQVAGVPIIQDFYKRWTARDGAQRTKLACLHEALIAASRRRGPIARLAGLLGGRDDISHPYLWSTLQLYGNWR